MKTKSLYETARSPLRGPRRGSRRRRAVASWRSWLSVAVAFASAMLIPFSQTAAQTEEAATEIHPAVVDALTRDLGLTAEQARARITAERIATERIHPALRQALSEAYAGGWFDPKALTLVVATTDPKKADLIRTSGARSVVVERNMQQLNDIVHRLDQAVLQLSNEQKRSIWAWGVDVKTNSVVITIPADDSKALIDAQDLITLSRGDPDAIRIERSTEGPPRLLHDVRGGDQYNNTTDGVLCSVGFSIQGGYITAGHCSNGTTGDAVLGYNGVSQGTFLGSVFPGEDRAWVGVNSSWTPRPCVGTGSNRDCSASNNVLVFGSTEADVGATVCRWGRTTGGPHCGVISAKDQTVFFNGGFIVDELTETSACAEGGDSGGPFIWSNQAQGTLTGGSGNCTSGGTTYFFPANLSLNRFNLTLVTAGSGAPSTPSWISASTHQSNGSYSVSWDSSAGATSYVLQRNKFGGAFTTVWTGSATTKGFFNQNSGEYKHRVKACNASGCSGWQTGAFVLVCNPQCL